ncbi:centromere protein J isoform X2 [Melanotaenia boesemani]|uniref:centromere protein J isoform X2 n=1 Tax=Melanotaenia boesemani TaxID=1250792 RepID=UPI001C03F2B3|nr:centromere protein J isoform X2 [Melanotaenia boesemani]
MPSPAGPDCSQRDILARWMPSSTRAGVILNPSSELAGSLRHISAIGTTPLLPNDSFSSEFAPLPASADSSCIGVERYARSPGGENARTDKPVNSLFPVLARMSDKPYDSLDEMASKSQDLPLMMKLEQLRKWQQHMQEQLKAHQLEELLSLQEEQQRLLGVVNGSKVSTRVTSGISEAEWDEDSLHRRPDANCWEVPRETCDLRQEQLSKGQGPEDPDGPYDQEEGMWNSREDDQDQSVDTSYLPEEDDALIQPTGVARAEGNGRNEDESCHERPIRPGIGGQKQTFEELLEEQLRLEEQRLKSVQQQQSQDGAKAHPKRTFLKRGEGLSRFTNKCKDPIKKVDGTNKPQPKAISVSRSTSAPALIQKGSSNCVPRFPVQRKTAVLNKENRAKGLCSPPQDVRGQSKAAHTKVLASHQRQNTEGPGLIQTKSQDGQTKLYKPGQGNEHTGRKAGLTVQVLRNCGPSTQPNPVTKQVGVDSAKEKSSGSRAELTEVRTGAAEGRGLSRESFELSFQEKLQRWECNRQLENMELGEFELLEQAAEELSFSSNSSFVMKVLKMDQQKRQQQVVNGRHQRRLSSTPIKSPTRGEPEKCPSAHHSDVLAGRSSSVDSGAPAVEIKGETLMNKVNPEVEDGQCSGGEDKYDLSDLSSNGGSEFGDQEVVVRGTMCFPAPSNPPYDKRPYQDEDSFRDSASDVAQGGDEESDGVLSNADDSTLIEDGASQHGKVVFDDDDTWNDMEDTTAGKASESREVSLVSKTTASRTSPLLRKVAVSKVVQPDKSPEPDPPPASQLMTRLFPSLKPKASTAPLPSPPVASESRQPKDETVQQAQSRQLRERLVELEIEIERFKKENATLTKLRQENEKKQEDLRKELLEFEQTKSEEMTKFEEYKREENRKLQKERKLFEKHASAARAIPDKKEREEIQLLKQQLSALQEEVKRKDSRWASTHSRLRQQIDSLSQENSSLRDEIQMLEKLRISALKKTCITAEKETETRDSLRISENNVPSVTKGVTFASPLDSRGSVGSPPAARRNSKDGAGMKSNLRRSARSGSFPSFSSSSPLPGRKAEEKLAPASKSQDYPPNQDDLQECSLKIDLPPKQAESREAEEPESALEVITHPDGKIEKVLASGDRLLVYPNGTRKEVSADGLSVKVTFFNGDTKQITADQRVTYHYAEAQTTHISYPDGMEVLHFPNNQTEKHFPDGRKEIVFPDQTVKNLFPDGKEESVLTDGTIIQVNPDGTKEIHFNTGQKEIHTADYKRREYPDGTVKTVYTDGRQETRYPTGRLRIKDKEGNVVLDNWT